MNSELLHGQCKRTFHLSIDSQFHCPCAIGWISLIHLIQQDPKLKSKKQECVFWILGKLQNFVRPQEVRILLKWFFCWQANITVILVLIWVQGAHDTGKLEIWMVILQTRKMLNLPGIILHTVRMWKCVFRIFVFHITNAYYFIIFK